MKIILVYSMLICLLSCTATGSKEKSGFKTIIADTTDEKFNDLEFSKFRGGMLNLPQIYKGVDSFEVRIWNFGMLSPWHVVTLRYFYDKWILCNYTYQVNGKNMVDSSGVFCKQINPAVAIEIENTLTKDSILNLPSQREIPNFKDNSADGDTYFIEIATKGFYKSLGYHNPQYYND